MFENHTFLKMHPIAYRVTFSNALPNTLSAILFKNTCLAYEIADPIELLVLYVALFHG